MNYEIVDLVQGSESWKAYRKNKISATDAGALMGLNPWKTPLMLFEEKLGLREPQPINDAMREGSLMEEKAREYFVKYHTLDFKPAVLVSKKYDFAMASLDGIEEDGAIIEIKCGVKSHEMAKNKEIPPYYYAQLQHQMMVADKTMVGYFSYRSDEDNIFWTVNRDDIFIEKMIEAEKAFFQNLMDFTPPPATNKDYVKRDDKAWDIVSESWRHKKNELDRIKKEEEALRQELISLSGGVSTQGGGITLTKYHKRGLIDYNAIEMLKSIDLNLYRKKPSECYRITQSD